MPEMDSLEAAEAIRVRWPERNPKKLLLSLLMLIALIKICALRLGGMSTRFHGSEAVHGPTHILALEL